MQSAASVKFVDLILATALISSPALAAVEEVPLTAPANESLELDPAPEILPQIQIIVVGRALPAATLERVLGPALKSQYSLRFESAPHFKPEDLFRVRTQSSASVRVWVDTSRPKKAQLYFANREGTRYLMRTFGMSESLDEMDREALAQAIEWSLEALVEGTEGLTRAEAQALLAPPSPPPSQAEHASVDRQSRAMWRRQTSGWLPEVALLHQWTPHSTEMLAIQGPVLRVGFDRLDPAHQYGVSISAQYQYPARHAESGVAIELESVASRADIRYLATQLVDGSAVGLRVGLGLDAVFSSHEVLDWERFRATQNQLRGIPLVTGGLIWQFQVEPKVRLEFSLGAEVDLVATQYDIVLDGGTATLLPRWPVRPSFSVGIEIF